MGKFGIYPKLSPNWNYCKKTICFSCVPLREPQSFVLRCLPEESNWIDTQVYPYNWGTQRLQVFRKTEVISEKRNGAWYAELNRIVSLILQPHYSSPSKWYRSISILRHSVILLKSKAKSEKRHNPALPSELHS